MLKSWRDKTVVDHINIKGLNRATSTVFPELFPGGTDETDHLPVKEFRRGFVGCIQDLSIGQLFDLDLMKSAATGRNVDVCKN